MAEYDPRPGVFRRDHTFDKLRKALPRKVNTPRSGAGVTGGVCSSSDGGGSGSGMHQHPPDFEAVNSENQVGEDEAERELRWHEAAASDDGYSSDDRSRGDREDKLGGGGGGGAGAGGRGGNQSPLRADGRGIEGDVDSVGGSIGSAQVDGNCGGGAARSGGGMANTGNDGVAAVADDDDGGPSDEVPPESSPLTTLVTASTSRGAEESDENSAELSAKANDETAVGGDRPQKGGGRGGRDQTKRPVTAGQRKVSCDRKGGQPHSQTQTDGHSETAH